MKPRSSALLALLAAVPASLLVACSSDDAASTTTTTTTTTTAPRNFQVSTPQGQVSLSLDGELPPGWPQDFPVPDSAQAAGSGSLGGSDSAVRVAVFDTSESGQDTMDFYADNKDLETKSPSVAGAGENFVGSVELVSPWTGSVTVLSREGSGYLIVTLTGDGSGGTSSTTSSDTTTSTTAA